MIAQPVARYLARFGPSEVDEVPVGPTAPSLTAPFEATPVRDIDALIASARAEGFSEGQGAAAAAAEARLAQENSAFDQRLEASRQAWSDEQADRLAELLRGAVGQLEANIAGPTAEILHPFVTTALRERAVADLADAVTDITRDSARPAIRLTGPPDLVAALKSRLDETFGIELCPDDSLIDVSVLAGQTLIETRLSAWAMRLRDGVE
jgi:hypothetical protein